MPGDRLFEALAGLKRSRSSPIAMHDHRQGVDFLAVDQDIDLDHVRVALIDELVVERPIALGDALEPPAAEQLPLGCSRALGPQAVALGQVRLPARGGGAPVERWRPPDGWPLATFG